MTTPVDVVIAELKKERFSQSVEVIRCGNEDLQAALAYLQTNSLATAIPNKTILGNFSGAPAVPGHYTLTQAFDAAYGAGNYGIWANDEPAGGWRKVTGNNGSILAWEAGHGPIFVGPGQTPGQTNGNDAQPGNVGEYIVQSTYPGVYLASNTPTDIASITLTPGDWDVCGVTAAAGADPTSVASSFVSSISETSATMSYVTGTYSFFYVAPTAAIPGLAPSLSVSPLRFNVTVPTTLYLVALAVWTVKGYNMPGRIRARRIR